MTKFAFLALVIFPICKTSFAGPDNKVNPSRAGTDAGPEDAPRGWWCETRYGTCYDDKDRCEDSSCHWRRRAFVRFEDSNHPLWFAFETIGLCRQYHPDNTKWLDCKQLTVQQFDVYVEQKASE